MSVSTETLRSLSTPEQLETRLGTLDFVDGFPSPGTSELVYDHLDFVHALNVFLNGFQGASTVALRKGEKVRLEILDDRRGSGAGAAAPTPPEPAPE